MGRGERMLVSLVHGFTATSLVLFLFVGTCYSQYIVDIHHAFVSEVQLGIDLGTTFSVAATCERGKVSLVHVEGEVLTPSVVYFGIADVPSDPGNEERTSDVLVGTQASYYRESSPLSTAFGTKRIIGRKYDEVKRLHEQGSIPFTIVRDEDNGNLTSIVVHTVENGREKQRIVTPEQIGSMVLSKLKAASESSVHWVKRMLGFTFQSATVSIPVSFDDEQKSATLRAAEMAGFQQVRLIEEPIAAAMAHGLDRDTQGGKRVLVFDIGGGTLDVALLHLDAQTRNFFVEATSGVSHLGGEDFDIATAKLLVRKMDDRMRARVQSSQSLYGQLLRNARRMKEELSEAMQATVCHASESGSTVIRSCEPNSENAERITITREEFNLVTQDLVHRCLTPVEDVLKEAGLDHDATLDIILVGGSSRIPKLREELGNNLKNSILHWDLINPDQAVALGAARSWSCNTS